MQKNGSPPTTLEFCADHGTGNKFQRENDVVAVQDACPEKAKEVYSRRALLHKSL